jgi:hypothetical protein
MSTERVALLLLLADSETVEELKRRLSPELRADLIEEAINPYFKMSPEAEMALAGVKTEKAARARRSKKRSTT